jgi:hypothetical protein
LAIHGSIIAATKYSSVTHVIHGFAAQYFQLKIPHYAHTNTI